MLMICPPESVNLLPPPLPTPGSTSASAAPSPAATPSENPGPTPINPATGRPYWYKDSPARGRARNAAKNAVSKIAYGIAGGSKRFYALPPADRRVIRETAKRLHEQDVEFTRAAARVEAAPDGFVYAIEHPAFPGYIKIGMAVNVETRLAGFQTGCPRRLYRCVHAVYTSDRRVTEAAIHRHLAHCRAEGEWFLISRQDAIAALNRFANGDPA